MLLEAQHNENVWIMNSSMDLLATGLQLSRQCSIGLTNTLTYHTIWALMYRSIYMLTYPTFTSASHKQFREIHVLCTLLAKVGSTHLPCR